MSSDRDRTGPLKRSSPRPTSAVAVAIAPVTLVRQDLKQYTADAFLAILVLWLVVRLATAWSTRRLWTLVIVAVLSSLVSYASMFVGAAVMVSLVLVSAFRGNRQRLTQSLVAAVVTATAFGVVPGGRRSPFIRRASRILEGVLSRRGCRLRGVIEENLGPVRPKAGLITEAAAMRPWPQTLGASINTVATPKGATRAREAGVGERTRTSTGLHTPPGP